MKPAKSLPSGNLYKVKADLINCSKSPDPGPIRSSVVDMFNEEVDNAVFSAMVI